MPVPSSKHNGPQRRRNSPRDMFRDEPPVAPYRRWRLNIHVAWVLLVALGSVGFMAFAYFDRDAGTRLASAHPIAVVAAGAATASVHISGNAPQSSQSSQPLLPTWRQFAVAPQALPGQPMIAIVIDDMGIDFVRSQRVIELNAPLTTSFLPYGRFTTELAPMARAGGHELMLHLPMEPSQNLDPGPHALMKAMTPAEIKRQLNWNLDRFGGYVGVNNHMGSEFTKHSEGMRLVLRELDLRGLLFLDSITTGVTATKKVSADLSLPVLERDVFLDNVREERAIWKQLMALEAKAKREGYAIAIGHPYDQTIRVLQAWLPRVEDRGFALVPVSAIVDAPQTSRLALGPIDRD